MKIPQKKTIILFFVLIIFVFSLGFNGWILLIQAERNLEVIGYNMGYQDALTGIVQSIEQNGKAEVDITKNNKPTSFILVPQTQQIK